MSTDDQDPGMTLCGCPYWDFRCAWIKIICNVCTVSLMNKVLNCSLPTKCGVFRTIHYGFLDVMLLSVSIICSIFLKYGWT